MESEEVEAAGLEALPPRVSQKALAGHWNTSVRTLQRWRASGYGPPWLQIGGTVYYRIDDIRAFEDTHLHLSGCRP